MNIKKLPALRIKKENVPGKWVMNAKKVTWKNFGLVRAPTESGMAGSWYARRRKESDNL